MSGYAPIRDQFLRFGDLRPQGAGEWRGPFPLPPALAEFYAEVGPLGPVVYEHVGPVGVTIPGTALGFVPLAKLWVRQAGYRWDGNSGERLTDWPEDWLVIADQHADPLILEMSTGRVLYALHGAGRWDAQWLAPDLRTLAAVLAAVGGVHEDAGDDLCDDEGELRPRHREAAVRAAAAVLGGDEAARAFFDLLEW
ncbi:hypothetical protein [Achromobacter sp. AONIH1]|uniref:hypothetical protein n=1 Tax=Achromobacter sp. AONIH1 TaxID=1758194 RepID=UPI0018F80BC0|nr:hypothetical protein [Achromobacter sp. AONIH1]